LLSLFMEGSTEPVFLKLFGSPFGPAVARLRSLATGTFTGSGGLTCCALLLTGGRCSDLRIAAHGKRDTAALEIDLDHRHHDLLAGAHHFGGIIDKFVRNLADVHETVLMHADIDEGPEGGDIGHDAWEALARLE